MTDKELSLFTVLLGSTPKGRHIEQHDIFFGVANKLNELTEEMKEFWHKPTIAQTLSIIKKKLPGADLAVFEKELKSGFTKRDKVHIDAWMKVKQVDGYDVVIRKKGEAKKANSDLKLYFINLGGYKENEFEEYHKKMFVVATAISEALKKVMNHPFMKEYSPESLSYGGSAHLDDQHKVDFEADDIICVSEALNDDYFIDLVASAQPLENEQCVGYVKLDYLE